MAFRIDPVCGARVDESAAMVQADFSVREGKRYVFCSMTCKQEFDRNPKSYSPRHDPVCGKEVDPEVAGPEQVAIAGILGLEEILDDARRIGQIGHTGNPNSSPVFAGVAPSLAVKCHGRDAAAKGAKQRSVQCRLVWRI